MKLQLNPILMASLLTAGAIAWATPASSSAYPDEVGVCYAFQGDTQTRLEPCVISTGHGGGSHYTILNWIDGTKTNIMMFNYCPDENYDQSGFCRYTVSDQAAEAYERDVFLGVTTFDDDENMSCYRITATDASFCYRLPRS